jgi:isopenicillin N synthase-like dioxygenase
MRVRASHHIIKPIHITQKTLPSLILPPSTTMELPVIDLSSYLSAVSNDRDPRLQSLCADVSRTLSETGALLVKDPRCTVEDNDRFIDMMEKYFSAPHEFKIRQERSHLHYQVH